MCLITGVTTLLQITSYGPKTLDSNFEDSKHADDDKYVSTAC